MDQLYILIIIGIISLVNWLIKRSADLREQRRLERKKQGLPEGNPYHTEEQQPEPGPDSGGSPEEQMRRLMESLGLPMPEPDPEPVRVLRKLPQPEPAIQPPSLPPLPKVSQKSAPPASSPREAGQTKPNPWAKALASRDGARQAVVLREILGSPKALDPGFSGKGLGNRS